MREKASKLHEPVDAFFNAHATAMRRCGMDFHRSLPGRFVDFKPWSQMIEAEQHSYLEAVGAANKEGKWVEAVSDLLGSYGQLATGTCEKKVLPDVLVLFCVVQIVEKLVKGHISKANATNTGSKPEAAIRIALDGIKSFDDTCAMIAEFKEEKKKDGQQVGKDDLETLADASKNESQALRAQVTEWNSGVEMDYKDTLVTSLAKGEDKNDFWFAELSAESNIKAVLKLDQPAKLDLAIDLALLYGDKKKAQELQLTRRVDAAQRLCCKFLSRFSALQPVSRYIEAPKHLEFESGIYQLYEEVYSAVLSLERPTVQADSDVSAKMKAPAVVSQAVAERNKLMKLLCDRWDSTCSGLAEYLKELHPKERTWREYCIKKPDKTKMKEFTKHEGLITIGQVYRTLKDYKAALDTKCKETTIIGVREWHGKQKSIKKLEDAYSDAMLALTVAHAVKTIHFAVPAEKDKAKRKTLIDKAKGRVSAANLGKAQRNNVFCSRNIRTHDSSREIIRIRQCKYVCMYVLR